MRIVKKIIISMILLMISLILVYLFFPDRRYPDRKCRELQKHDFDYEYDTAPTSETWDTILFFFNNPDGTKLYGPAITGSLLYVRCRDVDGDGIVEFIIKSKGSEEYHAILKVDRDSGRYHVQSTVGLKVAYPEEGFYYH